RAAARDCRGAAGGSGGISGGSAHRPRRALLRRGGAAREALRDARGGAALPLRGDDRQLQGRRAAAAHRGDHPGRARQPEGHRPGQRGRAPEADGKRGAQGPGAPLPGQGLPGRLGQGAPRMDRRCACPATIGLRMRKRADHEPGFVLHTYPYKETSLIVEAFSRSFGRVALLARGARRPRSAMRGVLLSFHPLRFSWSRGVSGQAELGNLIGAEWSGALQTLGGRGMMCGFYLNELLLRLLPRDDPHEALFDFYAESLARLSGAPAYAPVLRGFEKRLLAELGY